MFDSFAILIQRDLSGSSECRRLVDNLIGWILDWNQRGWNGNVLNFFVRLSDWQNFEFCNHFWGNIGNGGVFLSILGLRAGLVSIMHYCRSSLAIIHLMCVVLCHFFLFLMSLEPLLMHCWVTTVHSVMFLGCWVGKSQCSNLKELLKQCKTHEVKKKFLYWLEQ